MIEQHCQATRQWEKSHIDTKGEPSVIPFWGFLERFPLLAIMSKDDQGYMLAFWRFCPTPKKCERKCGG